MVLQATLVWLVRLGAEVAASEHTCSDNMPCVHTYFIKEAGGILRIHTADCKQAEE